MRGTVYRRGKARAAAVFVAVAMIVAVLGIQVWPTGHVGFARSFYRPRHRVLRAVRQVGSVLQRCAAHRCHDKGVYPRR